MLGCRIATSDVALNVALGSLTQVGFDVFFFARADYRTSSSVARSGPWRLYGKVRNLWEHLLRWVMWSYW
jgi:hypothetical protein